MLVLASGCYRGKWNGPGCNNTMFKWIELKYLHFIDKANKIQKIQTANKNHRIHCSCTSAPPPPFSINVAYGPKYSWGLPRRSVPYHMFPNTSGWKKACSSPAGPFGFFRPQAEELVKSRNVHFCRRGQILPVLAHFE